jgi:hypothetical protein
MAIISTVSQSQFIDAFMKNEMRKDQFSYDGLKALYSYLWDYSEHRLDYHVEFDVVALCCDFREYEDFRHLQEDYKDIGNMDDLEYQTTVIQIPNSLGFIIATF